MNQKCSAVFDFAKRVKFVILTILDRPKLKIQKFPNFVGPKIQFQLIFDSTKYPNLDFAQLQRV